MPRSDELPCRRVLLVRHGHYQVPEGQPGEKGTLTPLGRRQASRVGKRLARLLHASSPKFEGLYASPWTRAAETAQIVALEVGEKRVRVKPYLHECTPLISEDSLLGDGSETSTMRDRQQVTRQIDRVHDRFLSTPTKASTVIIVAHGNLIRYLVARTLQLPPESWMYMDISHCSITELRVYVTGFQALISFNETGHLPPTLITAT